jgi:hypothetical protein
MPVPNQWTLSGGGITVHYSVPAAVFHYVDIGGPKTFTGPQIRLVPVPDLGTLASVTLHITPIAEITFTVLLPTVVLDPPIKPREHGWDHHPSPSPPAVWPKRVLYRHPADRLRVIVALRRETDGLILRAARSTGTRCSTRRTFFGCRRSRRRRLRWRPRQLRPKGAQQGSVGTTDSDRRRSLGSEGWRSAAASSSVKSSCISRSRSDCVWQRQMKCLRGSRKQAGQ